jgi:hypothetical protein
MGRSSSSTVAETAVDKPKKRKSQKGGVDTEDKQMDPATEERKSKKRKTQRDDDEVKETDSVKLEEKKEKKKKRLKREAAAILEDGADQRAGEDVGEENAEKVSSAERVKRNSKKEKIWLKRQAAANAGDQDPGKDLGGGDVRETEERTLDADAASGTTKKTKRTNKTGFPDPNEDAALSDQARKGVHFPLNVPSETNNQTVLPLALAYAFAQFHRPSKWKFHKARQNWIIRNVLSGESVIYTRRSKPSF